MIAKTRGDFKRYLNDNGLDITGYVHMKNPRDICGRFFYLYNLYRDEIGGIILWT